MAKKIYEEQKNSIYTLQKKLGLSNYALYKYANNTIKIDKMPVGVFLEISKLEKETLEEGFWDDNQKIKKYQEKGEK